MSIFTLENDISSRNKITHLIDVCKSSSMKMGRELRKAHYQLGEMIAESIFQSSNKNQYAVLILMRAGLPFGCGISDKLEEFGALVSIIFINEDLISDYDLELINNKEIIIVDAVINSGESVLKLFEQLSNEKKVKCATTVISNTSTHLYPTDFKMRVFLFARACTYLAHSF